MHEIYNDFVNYTRIKLKKKKEWGNSDYVNLMLSKV